MVDLSSDRPAWRQLADLLRRRIQTGDLPPGSLLPSEADLMRQYDVSRTLVRLAVGALRNEGLVFTRQGRGTFVRPATPVRRIAADRYRRAVDQIRQHGLPLPERQTSFTADRGISWEQYRLDKDFRETPAPPEIAELLHLDPGTPLLDRRFVFYADDKPQQMSRSCYPLDLVRGTPVADPAREPWPGGNIAQLATLGIMINRVEEAVRARMPTPEERSTLHIPDGTPVLTITRRMLTGPDRDQPIEAAVDIVMPADGVVLDYAIDL